MKKPLFSFRRIWLALPAVVLWLCSCQSDGKFSGFDADAWKDDRLGCGGKRQALRQQFDKIRTELKGSMQDQVLRILGKPDYQRLHQRNQKFYVYFTEPGPQCDGKAEASQALTVVIRFSALGIVTEVLYNNGRPDQVAR